MESAIFAPIRHRIRQPSIRATPSIKMTSCTISGSDLHLYDSVIPGAAADDIMGYEFMGEVVEVGAENKALSSGTGSCSHHHRLQ